ncbi:DNA-3-methyladenine glycosylase family protein [Zafaria cholistanensis]|uniref:DNA-3-methyladenine glycosylase family protein n=1 Tax=Zafaria cholistanensis TaxID=1682741 RepID=UPI001CEC58D9|nr:3-methyladenine DNA glycosylase [Zafaria cholistanensis]
MPSSLPASPLHAGGHPGTAPAATSVWVPQGPYSLESTLSVLQRGTHDPCTRVGRGEAWLCFSTPEGPASLRLTQPAAGPVAAEPGAAKPAVAEPPPHSSPAGHSFGGPSSPVRIRAWGPGARAALAGVPRLLGAGDDWSGFDESGFRASLPRAVNEARRRNPGLRLPATGRVFDALVPAILEQKVTVIEARYAWRYLVRRFGSPAPGPVPEGMAVAPDAHALRRVPSWEWHAARVDAKRSMTILRAAEAAAGLDRLGSRELTDGVSATLQTVPGIGPWTAAEVLQRTHGDPDSVSVGDFHLAAWVGYALTGRKTDDAGMLRLLEPWAGHRQRFVRMLGLTGFRKPSYGPRLSPEDHRRR